MRGAGKKAIAEAQRKRWTASRGEAEPQSRTRTAKPKRKLSAAGRAATVAALKRRWAAKKVGQAVAKKGAVKKSAPRKAVAKKVAVNAPATAQKNSCGDYCC
jgi:hypothetical protein